MINILLEQGLLNRDQINGTIFGNFDREENVKQEVMSSFFFLAKKKSIQGSIRQFHITKYFFYLRKRTFFAQKI